MYALHQAWTIKQFQPYLLPGTIKKKKKLKNVIKIRLYIIDNIHNISERRWYILAKMITLLILYRHTT